MVITLIILALSAFFFVNGKIRSDVVALCALVLLILCGILTPEEALSGFSNSIVIMMVGLFVVGGAIFQTGLAKMISSKILQLAGKSELKLFILIMLVTSAIGAFVSNTGTVALMLPIVVSMAVSANVSPSRFLMPLAFASSMGGMATLIGTPPNLVIQNALLEQLNQDYVVGLKARGMSSKEIYVHHVLPHVLTTLSSLLGLSIGHLLGGTAIIETIFSYQGLGNMVIEAIRYRDYPIIQAYALYMALIYVCVNFLVDFLQQVLNPQLRRVRHEKEIKN